MAFIRPCPRVWVLAIFKNEADVLDEWVRHHIEEGVSRLYLVDNGAQGLVSGLQLGSLPRRTAAGNHSSATAKKT